MEKKIRADLIEAMKARDQAGVLTLRLLLSEISNLKIQKGSDLSDADVVSIIQKAVKQRKESIESYRKGAREDLASKEEKELNILQNYLPEQLSDEELTKLVHEVISEACGLKPLTNTGAQEDKNLQIGKIIGMVMGKAGQRADGSRVSLIVKEQLQR